MVVDCPGDYCTESFVIDSYYSASMSHCHFFIFVCFYFFYFVSVTTTGGEQMLSLFDVLMGPSTNTFRNTHKLLLRSFRAYSTGALLCSQYVAIHLE